MNQHSASTAIGGTSGATLAAVVIVWVLQQYKIEMPSEVAMAITGLLAIVVHATWPLFMPKAKEPDAPPAPTTAKVITPVLCLLAATSLLCPAARAEKFFPANLTGFGLTWDFEADTFNPTQLRTGAPAGSLTTTYGHGWRTFANGGGGEEVQCYGDSSFGVNPFTLNSNGYLAISIAPATNSACPGPNGNVSTTYGSGVVTTQGNFSQTYGYFECRVKMPAGAGMWPACWLTTASGAEFPEIDIVEAFGAPNNGQGGSNQMHWDLHSSVISGTSVGGWVRVPNPANIYTGYHAYGVDWEPDFITWYFDGRQVARTPTPTDANVPMFMIVNVGVGGSWAGAPSGESSEMDIDYIRIFKSGATAITMQSVSSPDGGGTSIYGATP